MKIEFELPNNTAKEELNLYQEILNIDGERCPFRIINITEAHFTFYEENSNDTRMD